MGCRGCVVERGGYSSPSHGQVTECVIFVDVVDLFALVFGRTSVGVASNLRRTSGSCPLSVRSTSQHDNIDTSCVRLAHFSYPLALLGCGLGAGPRWPRSSGIARRAAPTPVLCPARGCFTLQTCNRLAFRLATDLASDYALCVCGVTMLTLSLTHRAYCMQSINRNKTPTQLRTCGANNPAKPA